MRAGVAVAIAASDVRSIQNQTANNAKELVCVRIDLACLPFELIGTSSRKRIWEQEQAEFLCLFDFIRQVGNAEPSPTHTRHALETILKRSETNERKINRRTEAVRYLAGNGNWYYQHRESSTRNSFLSFFCAIYLPSTEISNVGLFFSSRRIQ